METITSANSSTGATNVAARVLGAIALSVMMLTALLITMPPGEASALSGSPCPHYSIQDVFADPNGNWDGDQVSNSDELYNGLNPCVVDTNAYCAGGGNPLCTYYTYLYVGYATACQQSINAYPTGDYDGDGIRNADEIRQGANPCAHPCPHPTSADLALNPNGSWDNDGISNAIEVAQGTDPCSGITYNPCPRYTYAQVNAMPSLDWDRDGISNASEVRQGTSPCVFNQRTYVTQHQTQTTNRLPHVSSTPRTVYVAPVAPTAVCPYGYPYYHRGNGLCYANPVGQFYGY